MRPVISVHLNNPSETYDPGQIVAGSVFIDCEEEDRTHGLIIKIVGRAYVYFTEKYTTYCRGKKRETTVPRTSEEKYISSVIIHENDGTTLHSGRNTFPFSTTLPLHIPSSFRGLYGYVKYEVKVNIIRSIFQFNDRFSKEFRVNSMPSDLNNVSLAPTPVNITKEKTICCLWCESDPITLTFEMHRMGYVPGEYLSFKATVRNSSYSEVTGCTLMLFQRSTYYAQMRYRTSSKQIASAFLTSGLPLLSGASHVWQEDCLRIPVTPISKFGGYCRIIDVEYQVTMEVEIRGYFALRVNAPIIIGTIPLRILDH